MADEFFLPLILAVTGVGAGALVAIAGMALFRRQSLSHILVTLAIGTLLLRSVLGFGMLGSLITDHSHHVLEHVLDLVVIGLLFIAIYVARRIDPRPPTEERYGKYND